MSYQVYAVLHLISGFLLVAVTFQAFAAPDPARRKRTMIATGVLSLLMLTGGFGLLARLKLGLEPWVWIKVACWLVLSGLAGLAFRRPLLAKPLTVVATFAVALAVYTVYDLRFQL
jgi:hypothetical protein